jgi:hypothetical protein
MAHSDLEALDDAADRRADERCREAAAAQARADEAHGRSAAARDAADRALTEYARSSHRRAAELHAGLAVRHEERARALHARGEDPKTD